MSRATHCPYCALQCAMFVEAAPGQAPASRPAPFPTNRGGLCRKGWTSAELLASPQRLTAPLLRTRRGGDLAEVDWDTALDHVADRLAALRARHGADAVAVFGSGGLTNEKSYLLGKFARVALGTSQIDYNGRFCMSSAAAAGNRAFGLDRGLPFPLPDLAGAEVVLLAGANPAETMPPMMRHLAAPRLIVVDPRRTATAEQALKNGGMHLAPRPGTDLALALGLLHAVRAQGLLDTDYIAARTTGFEDAWRHAAAWWPEQTEQVTGVPAEHIRAAARMLAAASGAYVLTGRGTEQHAKGTDTVSAWINLALALGLPGRVGSGYGCITGQGNGQGGREHGQKADQLPGYRRIDDPAARAHVARVWGVDPGSLPGPGRSAFELLDALGGPGGPRALLVFGSNPAVSAPDSERVRNRLARLDLLVTADFVLSETAAMADVVLPVAQWAEEEGTMTNLEGRLLRRRALLTPPPGVRTDLEVIGGLARRLGQPAERFPADPGAVLAELGAASAGGAADYSGVSVERLEAGEEVFWPVPDSAATTPRLFLDSFAHPDGRARFAAVGHRPPAEAVDPEYPLLATTGRVMGHYQSGAQTRRIGELTAAEPEAFVEVHPDTGARSGLADGALARVVSRRGATLARVRLTDRARTDTVFLPFHFAGPQAANNLTNAALDPTSRMPEFKVSAVRLEPAGPQDAVGAALARAAPPRG
ncbi:molybdopterin oxidoreductase family protein [Streptomonospora nanhaiensis]|uniref:Assimilatory nitrate reductase catalytic subunit n=1 Tax=Streptomonospora nanhaiensis TaxID=1323731 RepID=A0A853BIH8_9ACTN|nr:molybdopterin oxidoreductase family protein [Streptomonospora nanhaiensis]MBV2366778.1 molybdopterin oxidoreductase family protein [Streptomonospora nanhaiensis]MBX9391060.1 molybdopterin oxidoreductase family protein [Streptomonospora nanhaiensis]NYI94392.1 assimilatory nitrate reductase catalytic subunit [Streptomonospora nanhaiensis]